MRLVFIVLVVLLLSVSAEAQKEDYNWISGTSAVLDSINAGLVKFSIQNDSFNQFHLDNSEKFAFALTNSAISDGNGELLVFSNGMQVRGRDLKLIENGDSINFNKYWSNNFFEPIMKSQGLRLPQGMLMLPWPDRDSVLMLALNWQSITGSWDTDYCKGLFMGIIDVSTNMPKVIEKNIEINQTDSLNTSSLQACRHANGRDWWILVSNRTHNKMYTYLFSPEGLRLDKIQDIDLYYPESVGDASFSPLGDKYVMYQNINNTSFLTQGHFSLYDFDRCTGELSNHQYAPFEARGIWISCVFSPNGEYLYTNNGDELRQYQVYSDDFFNSWRQVAVSDGFESDYGNGNTMPNYFTVSYLAPDGRIYISGGQSRHLHRIEYPNEEDKRCIVNQHIIETLAQYTTMPNFPHFRLGPLDGSGCDTLGLDNHPVAKFRYEQDTSNYLAVRFTDLSYYRPESWSWTFGDGETYDGKKPEYHIFPSAGTYEVCLTVSNENSEDTNCRWLQIGPPSNTDDYTFEGKINVGPNPVAYTLNVDILDYIPAEGRIELYNMSGQLICSQSLYNGLNSIEIQAYPQGTYIYKVYDGDYILVKGKVVKMN
jgi:PKD repeat protein